MDLFRQPVNTHIEVGLHEKLPRSERRVEALLRESKNPAENGENVGEKRLEK